MAEDHEVEFSLLADAPGRSWVEDGLNLYSDTSDRDLRSIAEVGREFGLTARALRFYEAKGLIEPLRDGAVRRYDAARRKRLALLVKAKRLGFTLAEIRPMLEGVGSHALDMTRGQCVAQIRLLEERKREIEAGLVELRRVYSALSARLP